MKNIFVSSTFRDMHEERDILHERVMPELNEYAAGYGESVSFCDLRWGVNTEDLESEEGSRKVLSVCLDEIDRCRPYMLVILGERYGWIPEPETMLAAEEGREGLDPDDLEKSVTALEIEYGALRGKGQLSRTLFYFREFEGPAPEGYGQEDALHAEKLSELKARIRKLAGENLHTYTVSWDSEKQALKGMEQFAAQVTEDVKKLMEAEWKAYADLSPYEKDRRFQWDYARQKGEQFRAREGLVEEYIEKLNHGQKLLILTGPAGSGKSTLMAKLALQLRNAGKEVLPVFCGSTVFCRNALDVIRYIVRYIEDRFFLPHFEEKADEGSSEMNRTPGAGAGNDGGEQGRTKIDRWTDRMKDLCAWYTEKAEKELVILVDAADQLTADEARERLRFIPPDLSDKVKAVCSFLDTFHPEYYSGLEETETVLPLEETDKREVVKGILSFLRRELSEPVIDRIVGKKGAASPLYLSLTVQRLVMMDKSDFEKIVEQGDGIDAITARQLEVVDSLPENLDELCMDIVHAASGKLGGYLAELAAQYIALSRYGLREKDLEGILTARGLEWNSLDFTLFIRYMKSFFLLRDDGRWDFTHRSIREGFRKHSADAKKLHREILEYLKKLDVRDEMRVGETAYHCYGADDKEYFIRYVSEYEYQKNIIGPAAKTAYEISLQDGGEWLCGAVRRGEELQADRKFTAFLIFDVKENFSNSRKELEIQLKVFSAAADLAYIQAEMQNDSADPGSLPGLKKKWNNEIGGNYQELYEVYKKTINDISGTGCSDGRELCEVYEKALRRQQENRETKRDVISLCNLGVSYDNIAQVYVELGGAENLQKALEIYERSLRIAEFTAEKDPSEERKRELSISYNNVGRICQKLGGEQNFRKAYEMYEKGLRIAEALAEKQGTAESLEDLVISFHRMGDVYSNLGGEKEFQTAQEMYEKALHIAEPLAARVKTARVWRLLSISYNKVGEICEKRGGAENFRRAYEMYENGLRIAEFLAREAGTAEYLKELSFSYMRMGGAYEKSGRAEDLQKAYVMYEKSLEIRQMLAENQKNAESQRELLMSYSLMGDICGKTGGAANFQKARQMYEKSVQLAEMLAAKLGTEESLRDLSVSWTKMAEICEKQGGQEDLKLAWELYNRSLIIQSELAEKQKSIQSYTDQIIGLYHVACHPMTEPGVSRQYLEQMCSISEMLYRQTQSPRYRQFIEIAKAMLAELQPYL